MTKLSPEVLGTLGDVASEVGFTDADQDLLARALRVLGRNRATLATLTGIDGIARAKRPRRLTKRQCNDPHGIAGNNPSSF